MAFAAAQCCCCCRQVQANQDDRQRQLRQSQTGQTRADRQRGGHQNHRQDPAEPGLTAEALPRGEDHEVSRPSEHCQALRGHTDREDTLSGDGVRVGRRGLRLSGRTRTHEGEGGARQIPPDRLRRAVFASEAYRSSRSQGIS